MIVFDWAPGNREGSEVLHSSSAGPSVLLDGLHLVRPAPHHAPTIASWSDAPGHAFSWAGRSDNPFPPHVVAGWWSLPGCAAWVVSDHEGVAVAYGEVRDHPSADQIELAHLIVDPELRGRGVGCLLVRALLATSHATPRGSCFARVARDHEAGHALFRACGFERVPCADPDGANIRQTHLEWVVKQPSDRSEHRGRLTPHLRATAPSGDVPGIHSIQAGPISK